MRHLVSALISALCLGAVLTLLYLGRHHLPEPVTEYLGVGTDIAEIRTAQTAFLTPRLEARGLKFGAPAYIRIFKEEAELELWLKRDEQFVLWQTYPICNYSGTLGPKLKEGDHQSPEGFYKVGLAALNPNSSFHLSFNLGFPNAYDRAKSRTGSYLMVHGNCVSVGCYAMTDPAIEQIYVMVEAALREGQTSVPVHAFPFRMSPQRLAAEDEHRWHSFWQELQPAYLAFEQSRIPPAITQSGGRYIVQ